MYYAGSNPSAHHEIRGFFITASGAGEILLFGDWNSSGEGNYDFGAWEGDAIGDVAVAVTAEALRLRGRDGFVALQRTLDFNIAITPQLYTERLIQNRSLAYSVINFWESSDEGTFLKSKSIKNSEKKSSNKHKNKKDSDNSDGDNNDNDTKDGDRGIWPLYRSHGFGFGAMRQKLRMADDSSRFFEFRGVRDSLESCGRLPRAQAVHPGIA